MKKYLLAAVFIAFATGFYRANQLPAPAAFKLPSAIAAQPAAQRFESRFASQRLHTQAHAASLVELKDGRLRGFWFSGSREGAPDVEIHSALFDPATQRWSAERRVIGREDTQTALLRFVGKVGNPVAGYGADNSLWLYYVTVSLGGWGGSSITAMQSQDDGETWSAPRRLITSPFLNLSTLVRGATFLYQDGTVGFPVYHEFIAKFGELLRLNGKGDIIDKQRLVPGGRGSLQPVILVKDANEATVLMRYAGPAPHRALEIGTGDGGQHWSSPKATTLRNPDSALSAIRLPDGRLLAALNDIEEGRDALMLMASSDGGNTWRTVYSLEDERGQKLDQAHYLEQVAKLARDSDAQLATASDSALQEYVDSVKAQECNASCRHEYSYPWLLQTRSGDFHVVYTWNRSFIKHVQFSQAWLDRQLEQSK